MSFLVGFLLYCDFNALSALSAPQTAEEAEEAEAAEAAAEQGQEAESISRTFRDVYVPMSDYKEVTAYVWKQEVNSANLQVYFWALIVGNIACIAFHSSVREINGFFAKASYLAFTFVKCASIRIRMCDMWLFIVCTCHSYMQWGT